MLFYAKDINDDIIVISFKWYILLIYYIIIVILLQYLISLRNINFHTDVIVTYNDFVKAN